MLSDEEHQPTSQLPCYCRNAQLVEFRNASLQVKHMLFVALNHVATFCAIDYISIFER